MKFVFAWVVTLWFPALLVLVGGGLIGADLVLGALGGHDATSMLAGQLDADLAYAAMLGGVSIVVRLVAVVFAPPLLIAGVAYGLLATVSALRSRNSEVQGNGVNAAGPKRYRSSAGG